MPVSPNRNLGMMRTKTYFPRLYKNMFQLKLIFCDVYQFVISLFSPYQVSAKSGTSQHSLCFSVPFYLSRILFLHQLWSFSQERWVYLLKEGTNPFSSWPAIDLTCVMANFSHAILTRLANPHCICMVVVVWQKFRSPCQRGLMWTYLTTEDTFEAI